MEIIFEKEIKVTQQQKIIITEPAPECGSGVSLGLGLDDGITFGPYTRRRRYFENPTRRRELPPHKQEKSTWRLLWNAFATLLVDKLQQNRR